MYVYISACKGNSNDHVNTNALKATLIDLGATFEEVEGCYKGVTEKSFKVKFEAEKGISLMKVSELAKFYNQESILVQWSNNSCTLIYMNGNIEGIGIMEEVDSTEGLDAYSIINGKIFTIK